MKFARVLAALALIGTFSGLPNLGAAQAMIGASLSSIITQTAVSRITPVQQAQTVAFDWLSNGASAPSSAKTKAALRKYHLITGSGSWICSPAGFGKRSVCYAS